MKWNHIFFNQGAAMKCSSYEVACSESKLKIQFHHDSGAITKIKDSNNTLHHIGHIHNQFYSNSNLRGHTPPKHTFWKIENLPFFENISFAGLKSKFLSTQQKFYMSPTHPINMSSIGLKLMKLEQNTFSRFFFRSL